MFTRFCVFILLVLCVTLPLMKVVGAADFSWNIALLPITVPVALVIMLYSVYRVMEISYRFKK